MGKFDPVFQPELKKYDSNVKVTSLPPIQSLVVPVDCLLDP